ncbi:MAG: 16S rRNA (uracil(1498)-N(3))-methyltransferase [Alphaproteobacteria bacterium]|nr:16S rRNA (uracil(1498)-N(3))-methyltransferase [Alphaproteobacteria bacterium]
MRATRFFVDAPLAAGTEVSLADAQAHQLRHVLRRETGAPLLLFNGRDGEWSATLAWPRRADAVARVDEQTRSQTAEPDLWLCFAPLKRQRIDLVAEKATELGAARLVPVLTTHTVPERVNVERLAAHAIEAAEQTERLSVPEVATPTTLEALLAAWPQNRRLLWCDETGEGPPIAEALRTEAAASSWAILIGPEGGFARDELARLRALPAGLAVGLGPRILRADTAALAALAIWQAMRGDGARPTPRLGRPYTPDGNGR